jgi:hypothetical protein
MKTKFNEYENLADKFIEMIDNGFTDITWDEFFDFYDIDSKYRNNFVVAAIYKQVQEKRPDIFE